MKNLIQTLIASALALFIGLLAQATAAVTVIDNPTDEQWDEVINSMVYKYTAQAGGASGAESKESILSNTTSTVTADLIHTFPESVIVQHDSSVGRVIATLGLNPLDLPILGSHNALAIRVYDYNTPLDGTSFENVTFNGVPIRNLFADGTTTPVSDRIIIQFDANTDYVFAGDLDMDEAFMAANWTGLDVTAGTMNTVPEPSATVFLGIILLIPLFHRNRKPLGN